MYPPHLKWSVEEKKKNTAENTKFVLNDWKDKRRRKKMP